NGISAICTDFHLVDRRLVASNFQIINGVQTVTALREEKDNDRIQVLFRLTKTKSIKAESGINAEIIRYNNRQNDVKASDFRSNDPIQLWLERAFREFRGKDSVPPTEYMRKRGMKKPKGKETVKFEEFGKVRYSYLSEPTVIHDSPSRLWTLKSENGLYEDAFGVGGALQDIWSDVTFQETLCALALYRKISKVLDDERREFPEEALSKTFRFHALALGGNLFRAKKGDVRRFVNSSTYAEETFKLFWDKARTAIVVSEKARVKEGEKFFTFLRSHDRWAEMKELFVSLTLGIHFPE
ncbi:MAG TPA: AIPR family protein, partial [Terriglobales bacterium]